MQNGPEVERPDGAGGAASGAAGSSPRMQKQMTATLQKPGVPVTRAGASFCHSNDQNDRIYAIQHYKGAVWAK